MDPKQLHRLPASHVDPIDSGLGLAVKVLAVVFFAALAASLWAAMGCPGLDSLGLPA